MTQLALIGDRSRPIDLKSELKKRFLSYALSTIASRALPDVRDGLKPVHRRILYAMYRMKLMPENRYRKCAAVVGDVLGKYHPHGDQAAYDALARLAQDFSMRYPLIDGQGNFGSIDGDAPAAMRYTEARLTPISLELLSEIDQETVPFRPNYDATQKEPVYLPSRLPNILLNGSAGIAVGMATNIPPHNLGELIDGLTALLEKPDLSITQILKYIKGPDFPTGAAILATKKELREIYTGGRGSIKIRGDYEVEQVTRGRQQIIITSLPYSVNKSRLVEKIAQLIIGKKMPALNDVRDESAESIRIVLEPKPSADIVKIMAYLYRYTELEYNFAVNLTALDPTGKPRRMSIVDMLAIFLDFRIDVTERRLKYDLERILERLHILRALIKVLKDIDAAIKIIRKSKSRDEAKSSLMKKFKLDDSQVTAVLDMRLSSLVAMEINKVRLEAAELEARRAALEAVLKSKRKIKGVVKKELLELKKSYGDKRRTALAAGAAEAEEFSVDDFVEHEACFVIVSRNGWVRRIKSEPNESQLRFKEGDSLLKIIPSDTSEHIAFFSSSGKMYVTRAHDLSQTTGFGDPVQAIFKFGDGERLVAADYFPNIKDGASADGELLVVMENGAGSRISKDAVTETTRSGRRYATVKGDNAVFDVIPVIGPLCYIAHTGGKGLLFKLKEIPLLAGPGAGVRLIKLKKDDMIVGAKNISKKQSLRLVFDRGRDVIINVKEAEVGKRASTGRSYGGAKKKLIALLID